jgi:hypothetical protein
VARRDITSLEQRMGYLTSNTQALFKQKQFLLTSLDKGASDLEEENQRIY